MTSGFARAANGEVVARLHAEEVALLRRLPDDLRPLLDVPLTEADRDADPVDATGADPVRERLFPRAYLDPTEEGSEVEWQRMVHPELVRSKLEALELLGSSLARATPIGDELEVVLTPDDVEAWLGVLNDARLALGTALGVSDDPLVEVPADDPAAPALAVYGWLTELQGALVEVLLV